MSSYGHGRAVRIVGAIFAVAVVVSIVHYTDNSLNFNDYPQSSASRSVSSATGVAVAWFAFTAAGIAGYLLFRRAPSNLALALLALYSGSGLIGIAHYTVPGATSMPWWRQAHVVFDIACGIAMFSFVMWATRAPRQGAASLTPQQAPR